jgi:eukaryotic-like serine/threonine-protein kinase
MVGQHISKYRVTEQIGRGGMGTVYRAIDETLHREVAIKVLNAELNDPNVARRFRAEAVTVARLNHPGIATIYELVQHEGQWLMVMEFLRGETLEHLSSRKGPLPVEQAADLTMQTLAALAHAHSLGVVHRDLKPANIMVTDTGTVKIMDFGIARVAGSEHLTSVGFMMGTPAYMAPEQVLGQEIDARADLYATGVVLYHLITGKLPFAGDTPIEMAQSRIRDQPTPVLTVRSDLPPWVGQVLDIALAREPARRFQTALLFREALRRGLANLPIETPGPTALPPELVATAAPGSMPIAQGGATPVATEIPRAVPSPVADVPTVAAALPAAPPAPASTPAPGSAPAVASVPVLAPAGRSLQGVGVAAVVLVVIAAGVLWSQHRSAPATSEPAVTAPAETPAPVPAASEPAPTAPEPTPATASSAVKSAAELPRGGTVPPVPASTAGNAPPADVRAPSSSAAGRAAVSAAATATAPTAARGRGKPATVEPEDPPLAFADLRAFVVTGKKAEEQPAVLRFEHGQITLAADKGDRVYASLGYKDVTSAAFVRAKNPRWFSTLESPPSDLDMPGGLFRSARAWLALQSRVAYLIVRLNDNDLRKVLDAVTERTGIKVELLAAQ